MNTGANFSLVRGGEYISSVSLWAGEGRNRKEREISLTKPQGLFLYHLPFPNAELLSISDILRKAKIEVDFILEILDILDVLGKHGIIEIQDPK